MAARKDSLRLQLVFFTLVRMLISTIFRMVYPFLPVFRDALNVPLDTLTRAVGLRSLAAALLAPFFGTLGDSRGRRTGMLVGMGIFVGGAVVVSLLPSFAGFVAAMVLMLLGKVTYDPSVQAYIGDRVPYARRSAAITVTEFSWSTAFIIGVPAMGWVIGRAGWLAPFQLVGLLVLACLVFLLFLLPKDQPHPQAASSTFSKFRLVLQSPAARAALLFTLFTCIANELVGLSFGVWLEDRFSLQLQALGWAAAALGIAELSGEGLVALFTDRLGKRRAIFLGVVLNCLACLLLPLMGHSYLGALLALILFYISFEFTIVSSIPLMTEVLPRARATVMASFFILASIGRAAASMFTPALYAQGFGFNAGVAILFNLVALACLGRLVLSEHDR
ncbi:MAG: MFS transporter [Anaerolineales bacterium]|nr:MFS transporter [Anaerolineales bacterium]